MLVNSLKKVINRFGSMTKVAKALGITQQSVSDWYCGRSEIPLEYALHLDEMMRGEVEWRDLVSFKISYRLKNLCLSLKEAGTYPCELTHVLTSRIDLPDDLNSPKNKEKPLEIYRPPCINEDYTLIFGHESVFAHKEKNKKTITCWRLSLQNLVEGKYITDDLVKAFFISERAAIGIALENFLGNRQGQRTDLLKNRSKSDFKRELVENFPQVSIKKGTKTRDFISKFLGFKNHKTYEQTKKILLKGCLELITYVDQKKISISKAAHLSKLTHQEQKNKLNIN